MCSVSAIYDYGRNLEGSFWNQPTIQEFKQLIEQAKKFDKTTGQPDCEDPEKKKWWKAIEESKDSDVNKKENN